MECIYLGQTLKLIVAWCERGKTTRKEFDLEAILKLNPEIVSSPAELLEL